ncbi:MAG: LysM peptidoglycan-binding domain-containing M23 family metallopeptidase [Candidatus Omnitrophica bacterium]|nr:LysM peptidoglycan-binding domain-containing M23 family metallopeptidase [Candidatus Omnitrophota bacterium]
MPRLQRAFSILVLCFLSGCATESLDYAPAASPQQAIPQLHGSYHRVKSGETLWRIAHSYGLEVETLASVNQLPSTRELKVGQKLFIPLPPETVNFLWPARGTVNSSGASHGIDITAPSGSLVRASRSGRVAVAARHLSGWGKTVVLDHLDGYLTVYSGMEQMLVGPGAVLRQGMPIGNLGSRALHFEIRYGDTPRNVLALLPSE